VDGFQAEGLRITWEEETTEPKWKSAFVAQHCRNLQVNKLTSRQGRVGSPFPVVDLYDVQQAQFTDVRPMVGAGVLVHVGGVKSEAIHIKGIDPIQHVQDVLQIDDDVEAYQTITAEP
jgi:hypothetical protein